MQTFAIAPSATKVFWLLPVVLVPVGIGVAALLMTFLGSRGARFEVSSEGLRLRGDFYGRLIPVAELRVAEARRLDFAATPELQPRWRTLGTGLPGTRPVGSGSEAASGRCSTSPIAAELSTFRRRLVTA